MNQLPVGVRDYLPGEVKERQILIETIKRVFTENGYERVITPAFEYYDSIAPALDSELDKQCIRFFDSSGRTLVLRPDHTAQIARIVSSRYESEKSPIKLYYLDTIFKRSEQGEVESFQAGIECIGEDSPEADAEAIKVCIQTLESLGVKNFGIDIGFQGPEDTKSESEKKNLLNGDYVSYGRIPARGGVDIVKDNKRLVAIYKILKEQKLDEYIAFNSGLIKPYQYYTGLIFECYIEGYGKTIGSGGRYNDLLGQFGEERPAVGCMINVSQLQKGIIK